ncbi:MAG: hypothetical protein ACHQT6_07520 [Candidatus Acidiferrales bacterium]
MTFTLELPGKLISSSASLLFRATQELLKWQTPVVAASELLAVLALVLRARFLQTARQSARP